jgi:hypothetical protein
VDEVNFVNDPEGLGSIINKIDAELHGLFWKKPGRGGQTPNT